jgi:hypothetical protein
LSAFFGLLFAPSVIVDPAASSWHQATSDLPAYAGARLHRPAHLRLPLAVGGIRDVCVHASAVITASAVLMTRRDT